MRENLIFQIKKTPLAGICLFNDRNYILVNKKGKIVVYDSDEKSLFEVPLPISRLKRLLARNRIFERVFHLTVRWGYLLENSFFFAFNSSIYRLDLVERTMSREEVAVKGTPLNFCYLRGVNGFDDGLVIGDYSRNEQREKVNLYFRTKVGNWEKVYSFKKNSIRHIHNIAVNFANDAIYVLTGDKDSECGVWKFKENFKIVEQVLVGQQKYRACQLLPTKDGFMYLTDMPFYKNKVMEYSLSTKILSERSRLYGSCINGCLVKNWLVFSTTVEPNPDQNNKLRYWLTNKPGSGIDGKLVKLCALRDDGEMIELMSFVHDGLPLRLFQYGTAVFSYSEASSCLYFTPIAVKKFDYQLYRLELCQKDA